MEGRLAVTQRRLRKEGSIPSVSIFVFATPMRVLDWKELVPIEAPRKVDDRQRGISGKILSRNTRA